MTKSHREALKEAVDARVRLRELHATQRKFCRGCGCDLSIYVDGCRTCSNRMLSRRKRAA